MTTLAPPSDRFAVLDNLIAGSLDELRAARRVCASTSDRQNLDRQTRAEADINALLEYRHVMQHR
jgi:hypothetical protein